MKKLRHTWLALLATLPCACVVTEVAHPRAGDRGEIRRAMAVRLWHVLTDEDVAGEVVLFHSEAQPGDAHYVVRNVWQQDMGLVDSVGRAYRFVPHAAEPVWVGTGTVAEGTARILQLGNDCRLVEVSRDFLPLPASANVPLPDRR